VKKILIIRFSSIGDIVLTTPVIRCIKKQWPDVQLHYATKSVNNSLLASNPYIDKIHLLDNDMSDLIQRLKNENFDLIIDLHNNLRSRRITLSLGKSAEHVNKLNWKKWLFVNFKINILPPVHIVDRYFEAAKALNLKNDFEGLDFFLNENSDFQKLELPNAFKERYIAWVIGGKHFTKIFPSDKIINICSQLDIPIILLGDKDDKARGEIIAGELDNVFNAAGKFSLHESAAIIKNAQAVITNDTGLMHIAAAFKKKIVSIWGNTVSDFGMYPYLPQSKYNFKIIEVQNLPCRPCSKIGFKKCPKKHFKCMNNINENEILQAVKAYIGAGN